MTKKHLALMKSYKKPIVLMGQQESDVSCVYFDDYGAAKLATDCLVRCGCQNIVHLGVTLKDKAAGRARRGGYLDTLEENHIAFREELIAECAGFTTQDGSGAIDVLRRAGIQIPEQVKLTAVGNNRMSAIYSPHLTSVSLSHRTGGLEAGAILMDMIQNDNDAVRTAQMQCRLYERESTGAAE